MASFAFWNVNKKDLSPQICQFAHEFNLDFISLCEFNDNIPKLISGLNSYPGPPYSHITGLSEQRFHIFTRFRSDLVSIRHEGTRFLILKIYPPGIPIFNYMLLHAPSQASFWSKEAIDDFIIGSAQQLALIEKHEQNDRSIVVGDFNCNPFSNGMVSAKGFHAIMDANECRRNQSRIILDSEYPYFYNPMWNLMGDCTKGPPGTLYHRGSSYIEQQWHMLDQVIVRPSMLQNFDTSSLDVIQTIGHRSLLNSKGRPCHRNFSDHLPLYFEINP